MVRNGDTAVAISGRVLSLDDQEAMAMRFVPLATERLRHVVMIVSERRTPGSARAGGVIS